MTTDSQSPEAKAAPVQLGFGANRFLKHQLRTGRMMTAGAGRESVAGEAPAAPLANSTGPAAESAASEKASTPSQGQSVPTPAPRPGARAVLGFGAAPMSAGAEAQAPASSSDAESSVGNPARVSGLSFGGPVGAPAPVSPPARNAPPSTPRAANGAPKASFAADIAASRQSEAALVHISTVKLLMKLLGSVATNPGLMANVQTRSDALTSRHAQVMKLGEALTRQCLGQRLAPEWLRAQAIYAAAETMCEALDAGMAPEKLQEFDERIATQIGDIARTGEAIAGRVGFDGYVVADTIETAQARLYVSITSAIGRLCVHGIDPQRAGVAVGEIVGQLEASAAFAGTKLDLRTAWLQGSLGRCIDLMIQIMGAPKAPSDSKLDEAPLAFAQRKALSLIQEVETYAQSFIQRKFGHTEGQAEVPEADSGTVPRAG